MRGLREDLARMKFKDYSTVSAKRFLHMLQQSIKVLLIAVSVDQ
jgi:hypothetical protein